MSDLYKYVPERWYKLSPETRRHLSLSHQTYLSNQKPKPEKKKRESPPVTRFTTQYAVDWGKKQGWTVTAREYYSDRLKRHFDLPLGMDVLFSTPEGLVAVQGAGKSERAEHWQRFIDRGGPEKARGLGYVKVIYAEFERGTKTPIKEERWV